MAESGPEGLHVNQNPPAPSAAGDRIELAPGVRVPESALRFQYARSSGPGGQNVNKTSSKAELWLIVAALPMNGGAIARLRNLAGKRMTKAGELHLASDIHRAQEANREEILRRLRDLIAKAATEPKFRRKTRPSKAAKRRRLESKRHRSAIKSNRRGGSDD